MMRLSRRSGFAICRVALVLCLVASCAAFAQQNPSDGASASASASAGKQTPQEQPGINQEFGRPLAAESAEAAGQARPEEKGGDSQEKMIEELKFSPSVRWMSNLLHVTPAVGYWVGILFDFGVLALLIIVATKKNLPAMFRNRTKTIQQGIEEARKASEEANRRLADIQVRLSKLDLEVAEMRAAAEKEAVAEEQRIVAAAQEDTRRVVETAEAEIAAATKAARRELKAYVADLAVTLAEHRIHVDAATDQQLFRGFVSQLTEAGAPGSGKDGR